jgi:O-antigen ligase
VVTLLIVLEVRAFTRTSGQATRLLAATVAGIVKSFAVLFLPQLDERAGEKMLRIGTGKDLRLVLWSAAYHVFSESPLWGLGYIESRHRLLEYFSYIPPDVEDATSFAPTAHNFVLQSLIDVGIVGTVVICVMYVRHVRMGFKTRRGEGRQRELRIAALGLSAAMLIMIVHSLVETILEGRVGMHLMWFLMGMTVSVGGIVEWERRAGGPNATPRGSEGEDCGGAAVAVRGDSRAAVPWDGQTSDGRR